MESLVVDEPCFHNLSFLDFACIVDLGGIQLVARTPHVMSLQLAAWSELPHPLHLDLSLSLSLSFLRSFESLVMEPPVSELPVSELWDFIAIFTALSL